MRAVVLGFISRDINTLEGGKQIEETGGKGWYTSAALAQCGVDVDLITWLPDEDLSLIEPLRQLGIGVHIIPIAKSVRHENIHLPGSHPERSNTVAGPITVKDFTAEMWDIIKTADVVHLAPDAESRLPLEIVQQLTNRTGTKFTVDLAHYLHDWEADGTQINRASWPNQAALLQHFETVFLSADDVNEIQNKSETVVSYARQLAEMGPTEIIITQGRHGSSLFLAHDNDLVETPAFPPAQVVDQTGAGDTFAGAYLADRLLGNDPDHAALFAATAAGLKIAYSGPLRETRMDVEQTMAEQETTIRTGKT